MSIDRDRLFKQSQSLENPIFCYWIEDRKRAQIEIIGAEFGRRARGGSAHLGSLQRRLNDPGDAQCHPVLKVEDIFERAIEPVCPEMRICDGIDQLPGDADPLICLANRAFKHITNTKFPPYLLHVYRLPLVGEARITGDD